jgi:hypothetical protein
MVNKSRSLAGFRVLLWQVEDKHDWVKGLEPEDASWLAHLPWTISLPSHGLTVVHAGLVPEVMPPPSPIAGSLCVGAQWGGGGVLEYK